MRLDDLYLWYVGDPERPRYVGDLKLVSAGKGVSLKYAPEWLESGFPLSEDLPLVDVEHLPPGRLAADAPRAVGAVDDARPDRWGEKVIRFVDRPARLSLMEYLYFAGDDRFGALGVSTSAATYLPRPGGPLPRLDQAQELSEVVGKIDASEAISALEAELIRAGGSIGGAKPKALIDIAGEQWVIKFFNGEPVDTPLVEHATMSLARTAGINVAETRIIRLAVGHAVAVRRFDRVGSSRLHSVSAATVLRAASPGGEVVEMGYPQLALVLRRAGEAQDGAHEQDARELFRRMVFNILVDNTDDHEKNHSLIVPKPFDTGRLRLSPAYDIVPTNSGQGFQEFVCGEQGRDSTLENAMSQCDAFGLEPHEAAKEVSQIIAAVDGWKEHFAGVGVAERDIETLADRIDGKALLGQRLSFDPSTYTENAKGARHGRRRRARSPFEGR